MTLPTTSKNDSDLVLADLFEEVTRRLEAGEPLDVEAYAAEHLECAEQLRELLPALEFLVDLSGVAARGGSSVTRLPAADSPAPVRGTLGDYRILREIGRGGMGVVYEAEQISLHRRVALKVLPFAAVLDPRHLQCFKNEAQAAASLEHPNIVNVYSVGCERGVHYYAMQYVEGRTLAEVIRQLAGARDQRPGTRDQGRGVATSVATLSRGTRDQGSGDRNQGSGDRNQGPGVATSVATTSGGPRNDGGMLSQRAALGEHAAAPDMPTPAPPVKRCHPTPFPLDWHFVT